MDSSNRSAHRGHATGRNRGTRPSDEEGRVTREKGTRIPYRIVVRSELGERHAAAFDGMRVEAKDGEVVRKDPYWKTVEGP